MSFTGKTFLQKIDFLYMISNNDRWQATSIVIISTLFLCNLLVVILFNKLTKLIKKDQQTISKQTETVSKKLNKFSIIESMQ